MRPASTRFGASATCCASVTSRGKSRAARGLEGESAGAEHAAEAELHPRGVEPRGQRPGAEHDCRARPPTRGVRSPASRRAGSAGQGVMSDGRVRYASDDGSSFTSSHRWTTGTPACDSPLSMRYMTYRFPALPSSGGGEQRAGVGVASGVRGVEASKIGSDQATWTGRPRRCPSLRRASLRVAVTPGPIAPAAICSLGSTDCTSPASNATMISACSSCGSSRHRR